MVRKVKRRAPARAVSPWGFRRPEPASAEVKFQCFLNEGDLQMKRREYSRAQEAYTKALALQPKSVEGLIARCKCNILLAKPEGALEDSDNVIKLAGARSHKGYFYKAEALYAAGDFEFALVFYHRAKRLRPDVLEIKLGVRKAEIAIKRAVAKRIMARRRWKAATTAAMFMRSSDQIPVAGSPSPSTPLAGPTFLPDTPVPGQKAKGAMDLPPQSPLTGKGPMSGRLNSAGPSSIQTSALGSMARTDSLDSIGSSSSGDGSPAVVPTPKAAKPRTPRPPRSSKRLIGALQDDREFLEDLLKDPTIKDALGGGAGDLPAMASSSGAKTSKSNTGSSRQGESLNALLNQGLQYIHSRAKFWKHLEEDRPLMTRVFDPMGSNRPKSATPGHRTKDREPLYSPHRRRALSPPGRVQQPRRAQTVTGYASGSRHGMAGGGRGSSSGKPRLGDASSSGSDVDVREGSSVPINRYAMSSSKYYSIEAQLERSGASSDEDR